MAPKTSFRIPMSYEAILAILIYMFTTITSVINYGFQVKLIPVDSIDSVYFPKNLTLDERHYRLIQLSEAHVLHLRYMISARKINATPTPLAPGLDVIQPSLIRTANNYYISQFFIGSQPYSPYLMVDTGSDITWVQGDGCRSCFLVRGGNFNYHESSTFHPLPCSHSLCVPRRCRQGICHYVVQYPHSSSKGWLSQDTFMFAGINQTIQRFPIVFGCGFDNSNVSFGALDGPNNVIAGVFGLADGPQSILRQLREHTKMRFSYCFPSWHSPSVTYTFLRFGDYANFRGDLSRRVQSTRLVRGEALYYVSMLGISVEGNRQTIDPGLFQLRPDGTGGFAIDSGSPQTRLVEPAYRILKEEMIRYFQQHYGWHPLPRWPYDLCFAKSPPRGNYTLPSMTYHFEGANYNIGPTNIFVSYSDRVCMVVMPISDPGPNLLGAFQQADHRFLFDVEAGRMSFVPDYCSYN